MLIIANPRRLFGVAGAFILSGLLLTPYDFAAAARTIADLTFGAPATVSVVLQGRPGLEP